jgi:aquaporin NIP
MRPLISEWFATFVLIFGGTGVVVVNKLTGGSVTLVGIALTWGLLVAVMAYACGPVSGAHMNPAVTVGLAYAGKHPWKLVPTYVLAQCAGAFTASLLLAVLTRQAANLGLAPTMPYAPSGGSPWVWECFVLEVWLTGVLMFVILSVSTARPEIASLGGFIAGGVIALEVLFCGPVTGASMNPARSLAPAVVGGTLDHLWLYLTAPPLGAVVAVIIWKVIHRPESTEVTR